MANDWKVKFVDDDSDDIQIASFNSDVDAKNWIKHQEIQGRYDPCGFEVVDGPYKDLNESVPKDFDPQAYVEEFKDYFGYKDEYSPIASYGDAADSLAHECALEMPTDTAAREIEGDAVMLLVLSGKEKAIEAGKALGDCMMKKTKHDEKTLLKRMKEAWGELSALQPLEELPITKVWIDDIRPAPSGYKWFKSVNSFIDHFSKDAPYLDNLGVVDIDHDAGDYAKDGGDYIKCLDYLEHRGVKDLQVRIHSQNPVGVAKMRQIIKKNGWKEIFDIYESARHEVDNEDVDEHSLERLLVDDAAFGRSFDVKKMAKDGEPGQFTIELDKKASTTYDPYAWVKNLKEMQSFIEKLLAHGCCNAWIIECKDHGMYDGSFSMKVGIQLLTQPFSSSTKSKLDESLILESFDGTKALNENWNPKFDDKPVDQFGQKWVKLDRSHYIVSHLTDIANDCQLDPSRRGPKLDSLSIDLVHAYSNGDLIVTVFGGSNGGGIEGICNFEVYLALVKKFISKLVGQGSDGTFQKAWLVDWSNDCCDDVWTLRFCLQLRDEQLQKLKSCTQLPSDNDDDDVNAGGSKAQNELPTFDEKAFIDKAHECSIPCTSAYAQFVKPLDGDEKHANIHVAGDFKDRIPLEELIFHFNPKSDEYAKKGWYQSIRCKNKWNAKVIAALEEMYPNGIRESED